MLSMKLFFQAAQMILVNFAEPTDIVHSFRKMMTISKFAAITLWGNRLLCSTEINLILITRFSMQFD